MNKIQKATAAVLTTAAFLAPFDVEAATPTWRDNFYWLGEINKATIIINQREGLLSADEAKSFGQGLASVLENGGKPGAKRPGSVITFEPLLIEAAGEDVTKIHAGRSSQDMLAAMREMQMREAVLDLAEALNNLDDELINLAKDQRDTVIPCYTNGVAAQPERYSHYLLAYHAAFSRDIDRLYEYYARLNQSTMGTTVLNGTSWPLNRDLMAEYLGFDGLRYNAYDAVQVYFMENAPEAGFLATSLALHVGGFIEDVMQQYAQPRPWILLEEGGANTYVSSAMPQKRNPGILNRTRTLASTIIGEAAGATIRSHNIPPGMADGRDNATLHMIADTAKMARDFTAILRALVVNPDRALEELNLDWTASQELADILMRDYGIPFRLGHHFASEMVGFARKNDYTPLTFPYEEAQRLYRENIAGHGDAPEELPLDEDAFRNALDPVSIVDNRATKGACQPSEIEYMMVEAQRDHAANVVRLEIARQKLSDAESRRSREFSELIGE